MHLLLTTILKRYKLFPTNILVLGDEELSSLTMWGSNHQLWGIVSHRDIVESGKISYPHIKLYAQKLESYRITGLMQLTYALHGQFNSLPINKWGDSLTTIAKHTSPYGLVIFDVKLPSYYEDQSKLSTAPLVLPHLITISSRQNKKGTYTYHQTKFEELPNQANLYQKTQTTEQYHSMTLSDIKKLTAQHFETTTILDTKGKTITKSADHIIIICQKGGPDWKPKITLPSSSL